MTTENIINANLFPQFEDWESLLELSRSIHAVSQVYYDRANVRLDEELRKMDHKEWGYYRSPKPKKDLFHDEFRLYLKEFGKGGIELRICWNYELQLTVMKPFKLDTDKVTRLLQTEPYLPIQEAFDKIEWSRAYNAEDKFMHYQDFYFGHACDGNWSKNQHELAWYAGNETENFIKQYIEKIEKFTLDEQVTQLLKQLHEETRLEH